MHQNVHLQQWPLSDQYRKSAKISSQHFWCSFSWRSNQQVQDIWVFCDVFSKCFWKTCCNYYYQKYDLCFKIVPFGSGRYLSGLSRDILTTNKSQIAKFMGPTWGPSGSRRPQMGLMLAPRTLLAGICKIYSLSQLFFWDEVLLRESKYKTHIWVVLVHLCTVITGGPACWILYYFPAQRWVTFVWDWQL